MRAQASYGFDGLFKRARQLGNGVMNFRNMRVNTHLYGFHAQGLDAIRFLFPYQNSVGLQFYTERPQARVFQNFKKIPPHHNFAAADCQVEDAGLRHLVEQVLDFRSGHLAVIVVIQVTVDASFVAPICQVQMRTQWNIHVERLSGHFHE